MKDQRFIRWCELKVIELSAYYPSPERVKGEVTIIFLT